MEKDDINSKPIRIKRVFFGSRVKKESAQSQALPVAVPRLGRTIFSDEPETAEEYLLMVAQEAAREPDVVVAYFSDEEEGEHQASCFGLVDDLIVPEDYESEYEEEGEEGSDDEDWEDGEVFEAHDFIVPSGDSKFLEEDSDPLDALRHGDAPSSSDQPPPDSTQLLDAFREARNRLAIWKNEGAFTYQSLPHQNDRQQWQRLAISHAQSGPSTSLLLSMTPDMILAVLGYHTLWFQEELVLTKARALWLYGLLSVIPSHFPDSEILADLLKKIQLHCREIISQNGSDSFTRLISIILLHFL